MHRQAGSGRVVLALAAAAVSIFMFVTLTVAGSSGGTQMILGQDPRDLIYGEDEEQDRALFTDARVLDELARTRDRKLTGRLHVPGDVLASYRRRTATLPAAAAAAAGSAASLPAASQHLTTSTSLREYGDREEPPAELLHSTVSTLQPTRPVGRSGRPASLVTFTNRTPSGSTYDITPYT